MPLLQQMSRSNRLNGAGARLPSLALQSSRNSANHATRQLRFDRNRELLAATTRQVNSGARILERGGNPLLRVPKNSILHGLMDNTRRPPLTTNSVPRRGFCDGDGWGSAADDPTTSAKDRKEQGGGRQREQRTGGFLHPVYIGMAVPVFIGLALAYDALKNMIRPAKPWRMSEDTTSQP